MVSCCWAPSWRGRLTEGSLRCWPGQRAVVGMVSTPTAGATGRLGPTAASHLRRRRLLRLGRWPAPQRASGRHGVDADGRATGRLVRRRRLHLRRRRLLRLGGGLHLNAPVVGMASTPDGRATGGWVRRRRLHLRRRRLLRLGGGLHLNAPVVGMASTPDGKGTGWWLPTAASSPTATPAFRLGRWPALNAPWSDGVDARRQGLLDGGFRRRRLHYGDAGFFGSPAGGRAPTTRHHGHHGTPVARATGSSPPKGHRHFGDARYFGTEQETIALYGDSLGMQARRSQYLAGVSGDSTLLRAYNGWASATTCRPWPATQRRCTRRSP